MDKRFAATAFLLLAYAVPVAAQPAGGNLALATSPGRSTGNDVRVKEPVSGNQLAAAAPLYVSKGAQASMSGASQQTVPENPANRLNWLQGGGG